MHRHNEISDRTILELLLNDSHDCTNGTLINVQLDEHLPVKSAAKSLHQQEGRFCGATGLATGGSH